MTFSDLGLDARLVARLDRLGLKTPTPIQQQAVPEALAGRDVLGLAQTGTGKTAAFGLPLVTALSAERARPAPRTARGLVLAPTRELANQIVATLDGLTDDLRVTLVVGGKSIGGQAQRLSRGTDILVATPGRLIDLTERRAVDLSATRFLVLDEADQMLDIGFVHALRRIAGMLAAERQTMMFSATMPPQMAELSRTYLRDPVRVEVAPPGQAADKVAQSVHFVPREGKQALLVELLGGAGEGRALVFSRTKHGADRLTKQLERAGFAAAAIHGNKSQGQRDRALEGFRRGATRVLVATDVAARGLDIPDVAHVFNFDLPTVPETYVHRIGRTARAGRDGAAVAFCAPDEMGELKDIQKVMKMTIPVLSGRPWEELPDPNAAPSGRGGPRRGRGGPKGGGGGQGQGQPGQAQGRPRRRRRGGGGPRKQAA